MIRVGERLRQMRREKGLTLDEVAKETKIRLKFLQTIENGDFTNLPSSTYALGFVKNYTQYLGLPTKEILALFRREFDESEYLRVLPESLSKQKRLLPGVRIGTTSILFGAIILFVIGFIFFQYRFAFLDPAINISKPAENQVVTNQTVTVVGHADTNTTVTINDIPVFLDKNGNFHKDVTVFAGSTTITAKVSNTFGRKSVLVRHITVKL